VYDFLVGPHGGNIRPIAWHQMDVVFENGVTQQVDGEPTDQMAKSLKNPILAMIEAPSSRSICAAEKRATNAARPTVINAHLVWIDDLTAWTRWHWAAPRLESV
jgi:hypothetical protein